MISSPHVWNSLLRYLFSLLPFSGLQSFFSFFFVAWVHCHICGRCALPSHSCKNTDAGCFVCGAADHKRTTCPNLHVATRICRLVGHVDKFVHLSRLVTSYKSKTLCVFLLNMFLILFYYSTEFVMGFPHQEWVWWCFPTPKVKTAHYHLYITMGFSIFSFSLLVSVCFQWWGGWSFCSAHVLLLLVVKSISDRFTSSIKNLQFQSAGRYIPTTKGSKTPVEQREKRTPEKQELASNGKTRREKLSSFWLTDQCIIYSV